MFDKTWRIIFLLICAGLAVYKEIPGSDTDSLQIHFNKDAQIEVGSPYAGVEFHHSSMLPQRISFYYPAANSIDISSDYWKRDTTHILQIGLKVGASEVRWPGTNRNEFSLTPYSVTFNEKTKNYHLKVSYRFCKDKPAMVVYFEITNLSDLPDTFHLFTNWNTSLRTSHTYALENNPEESYSDDLSTMFINYDNIETKHTQLFITGSLDKPYSINFVKDSNSGSGKNIYQQIYVRGKYNYKPAAEFYYKKYLHPNEKLSIVQIIGSCKIGEGKSIAEYLKDNYKSEVNKYEDYAGNYEERGIFKTGNKVIDNSYLWAKAVLAANQHYIDGEIVPMPCPAEYNFFFTHDVLLSDLAAVNFDIKRVKHDLTFIIDHADTGYIIPHAYYWKDSTYKTEYATPDNWNHLWFVILSGSYLRHSNDTTFMSKLYPYIWKSINEVLKNKRGNLIYAYRPDWWDIGRNFGPRSYMNILTIKAIRDFNYITFILSKNISQIKKYEEIADGLQSALNEKLWKDKNNYLMNYFEDGTLDEHYYMGSLLACHFNILDTARKMKLLNTAEKKLLDKKLGIYTVFPMDFQNLIGYLKFNGNEAGDPFKYINGGIWPHSNAWYALGLISINEKKKAYDFIKKVMTLDGVINSPNGQPAMYEYRNSNYYNPHEYGKVDKPQFMWAAAWYIYVMYHLWGIEENDFNIKFTPLTVTSKKPYEFDLCINGSQTRVKVNNTGKYIKSINFDNVPFPSLVIPSSIGNVKQIDIANGNPIMPYLSNTNTRLVNCTYDNSEKKLNINLQGFTGQSNQSEIISPTKPKQILINGTKVFTWKVKKSGTLYLIQLQFIHTGNSDQVSLFL